MAVSIPERWRGDRPSDETTTLAAGHGSLSNAALVMREAIRLDPADQECFAQALLSPPKPTPALERAFARRNKLLDKLV